MRIVAIANQKGGCGKTTTSINFAACLSLLQKSVLLVDLDPQGHCSCGLGVDLQKEDKTLYDLMTPMNQNMIYFDSVIRSLNNHLDLLPCDSTLNALEEEYSFLPNHHFKLAELLAKISSEYKKYDFVVLDCPPNLGVLTWNALFAANEVMIPVEPSFFSLHGLGKISETIQLINDADRDPLRVHALVTLFDSEMTIAQEILEEVKTHFKSQLFNTVIHQDVLFKEAAAAGKSIVDEAPNSSAFRDYLNLAVEYLEREWDRKLPEKELGWDEVVESHYGPKKVSDGILFQYQNKTAHLVEIAGDFNQWVPEPLTKREPDGLWQKVIRVENAQFRYKYIIDGEWQIDPHQRKQKQNDFGGVDSYMEISE